MFKEHVSCIANLQVGMNLSVTHAVIPVYEFSSCVTTVFLLLIFCLLLQNADYIQIQIFVTPSAR